MRQGVRWLVGGIALMLLSGCATSPASSIGVPSTIPSTPILGQVPDANGVGAGTGNLTLTSSSNSTTPDAANSTPAPNSPQVNMPAWRPGFIWDSTGSISKNSPIASWTTTKQMADSETLPFNGVAVPVLRIQSHITYRDSSGWTVDSSETDWLRSADQAELKSNVISHAHHIGMLDRSSNSTTLYAQPCQQMKWPFGAGSIWEAHCYGTTTESNGASQPKTVSERRTVGALEQVVVPAGTFQAYPITIKNLASGEASTSWFAPEACDFVKTTATSQGNSIMIELSSFQCNPNP